MKITTLIVLLATGFGSMVFAQEKKKKGGNIKIPIAVEKAFQKRHPNGKAKWEKEAGKYEAGFKQNGIQVSELYTPAGVLEESETEIAVDKLPAAVSKYVAQHQLGTVKEAAKITKADGSIVYEAEVKAGNALFDSKGNFIKIQKD
ncbi:PepSY-like domain-containing protein [Chryseobacterium sp. CBSDS_008]|uniref:PepSY-like domain-containing protein n=1 Tax=Chryseobacterium sp. CBSDS_008 TaxID=3415265 RepID=UPI003CE908DF